MVVPPEFFPGFERKRIAVAGAEIAAVVGGSGPPLLLLHGFPQSLVMWHLVAPALAERFTVIATDLRGYGESSVPASAADHAPYSFRAMAGDQAALMSALGFEKFLICGHDRGARTTHRMALDHPERVIAVAMLDILPTLYHYENVNRAFATGYYHWFFFIQPFDFPERLIGANSDYFLEKHLRSHRPQGSYRSPGDGMLRPRLPRSRAIACDDGGLPRRCLYRSGA